MDSIEIIEAMRAGERLEEACEIHQAINHYSSIAEAMPDYLPVHLNLCRCYLLTGAYDEAKKHGMHFLEDNYDDCEAYVYMSAIDFAETNIVSSLTLLSKTGKLKNSIHEKSCAALEGIGKTLLFLNLAGDAVPFFEKASQTGTDGYLYRNLISLGECYYITDQPEKARQAFSKAIILEPKNPAGWNNLGVVCIANKDMESAAYCFSYALKLQPDYSDAINNLKAINHKGLATTGFILDESATDSSQKNEKQQSQSQIIINNLFSSINKEENLREFEQGLTKLNSSPPTVNIGTYCKCNARCRFCPSNSWPASFNLDFYRTHVEQKLGKTLQLADTVSFCGLGEIFLIPDIKNFIKHINKTIPYTSKCITTNGIALYPDIADMLTVGRYLLQISLHAASAGTHELITGTRTFERIINQIKHLVANRDKFGAKLYITLVFVTNQHNISEAPDFVKMAESLGVNQVRFEYMTIFEPEQVAYSCFFTKELANEKFMAVKTMPVRSDFCVTTPPFFGEMQTIDKSEICRSPWDFAYIDSHEQIVNACCYAGENIASLKETSFDEIWNGLKYQSIRKALKDRKEHKHCSKCIKFKAGNINNFSTHVTFRCAKEKEIYEEYQRILNAKEHHFTDILNKQPVTVTVK